MISKLENSYLTRYWISKLCKQPFQTPCRILTGCVKTPAVVLQGFWQKIYIANLQQDVPGFSQCLTDYSTFLQNDFSLYPNLLTVAQDCTYLDIADTLLGFIQSRGYWCSKNRRDA